MRDWLPRQARRRATVSERILSSFELSGYQRVEVPLFEYADVFEKGYGNTADAVCFVEPETGRLAALRSDVTPQIARLVSSRHPDGPWPARFAYQASVLRRRRERARLDQQVLQAGFELIGPSEQSGDLEVLETATSALRATGLENFTVDLAHAQIVGALVDPLDPQARAEALECLALKDPTELRRIGARSGLTGRALEALVALPGLHGGEDGLAPSVRSRARLPRRRCARSNASGALRYRRSSPRASWSTSARRASSITTRARCFTCSRRGPASPSVRVDATTACSSALIYRAPLRASPFTSRTSVGRSTRSATPSRSSAACS
jgi:hypothetical protein